MSYVMNTHTQKRTHMHSRVWVFVRKK